MNLLRQLFLVSRPVSWPNTAFPFAAGYLVTQHVVDIHFVIGTLFFLIPYNLLMYGVNDVFDYESDIRNPRKGGMEGALSAKKMHRSILVASAAASVPFLIALLMLGTAIPNLILVLVVFFVVAYSLPLLRFKERPFIDSITSSIHFVGPLIYALALAPFNAATIPVVLAFFLWGIASHAFGAVQDVIPDREGGIKSIATVLGASQTVRFSIVLYALSGLIITVYDFPTALLNVVLFMYIGNIYRYRQISDNNSHEANGAWRRFIYLNQIAGFFVTILLIYLFAL